MVCSSGPDALGGMRDAKCANGMDVSEMKPVETVGRKRKRGVSWDHVQPLCIVRLRFYVWLFLLHMHEKGWVVGSCGL